MLVAAFLLISLRAFNCYNVYTDQFVIKVPEGAEVAKDLANKHGFYYLGHIFDDYHHLQHRKVVKRSYKPSYEHHISLEKEPKVKWYSQQKAKRRVKRDYKLKHEVQNVNLSDPRWPQMWYLNRGLGLDMNVQNAWIKGVTGKGIVVTILDDGLEKDHPDLSANYDPQASFDVNNHDPDPQPRYDFLNSNRHGTRCAGEVAASANNSICAVGIAYNAGIGGVKMLDGDVTDAVEARSLSLNPQHIDIYSASWGPDDDGKTVDGPGELATKAFRDGIKKGRNGLGSIFVWASGNGGREKDNCNCDGYTNSIWTLSISSATENGLVPWYSEACSSTLATTYSSGSAGEKQIVTTDLRHECTSSHTGTSASAPLAAAICALTLEANPRLTWRDMQHIVVRTAQPANLFAKDWAVNGVNRNVSHSFGYGMMDATAMVTLAKKWINVPAQKFCEVRAQMTEKLILPKSYITVSLKVQCDNVHYLEHVQAKISLAAGRRGDMFIYLTSPSGTKSRLLDKRPYDNSRSGFQLWPFMTVHCWGENPNGVWKLEVHNDGHYLSRSSIKEWSLLLYGTTVNPDKHQQSSIPSSRSTPTIRDSGNVFDQSTVLPFSDKSDSNEITFKKTTEDAYYSLDSSEMSSSNGIPCTQHISPALCIDCKRNEYILDNRCVAKCPISHTNITVNDGSALCVPCHYSCLSCTGPNDYQCSSCHGDSVLTDNYCMPKSLLKNLTVVKRWYVAMTVALVIVCILTLLMFGYVFCHCSKSFYNHNLGYVSVQKIDPMSVTTYQDSEDEA